MTVLALMIVAASGPLAMAGLVFLLIVISSIHASERRMNLSRTPMTRTEKLVRRTLGTQGGDLK
jgi:hypothetical protein